MEASIGVNLRVTAHSNQGGRKYMEDMFCVAYQPTSDERDLLYAYFGIFDGHGGREAAMYAKTHLMDFIVSQKNFWSDDDELVMKAIRDGFMATHYAMWKELENWPKTASGLPSTSGTTASVVFVRRGKMYIGHVGDSGIILGLQDPDSTFWRAKALTRDHKPESAAENARITRSGGKVISKSGVPRVVWNRPRLGHKGPVRRSTHIDEIPFLAVARSLGDLWSYNSVQNEFIVSPVPDVSVVDIDVTTHRCIILGSDGLWNMLNPQDAVNSVFYAERNNERQLLSSPPDVSSSQVKNWINPSKRLVDRALDRWLNHNLRADNTSVVTVVIDPPGPPKAQVLRQNQSRTHVVRQSVSSVTDPATSKTVPAMVLAPIQGPKPAQSQCASNYYGQQSGSRGFSTPVSSFVDHTKSEPRPSGLSCDGDRPHRSSLPVTTTTVTPTTTRSADKFKASSSNDAKTRRILLKRKFDTTHDIVDRGDSDRNASRSSPVSCSSLSSPASGATRHRRDLSEDSSDSSSRRGISETDQSQSPSKSNMDDVQIHEISSSSEAKSVDYSVPVADCSSETSVKKRKITRNSRLESSTEEQRPSTRAASLSSAHPKRQLRRSINRSINSQPETPVTTQSRSLRKTPFSTPTGVVKKLSRKYQTSSKSLKSSQTPETITTSRSSSKSKSCSSLAAVLGRSLRSDAKNTKRVTRSMNK